MRYWLILLMVCWALAPALPAKQRKLTFEERVAIVRGLTAEYATAKLLIPRSKNPLKVDDSGVYDKEQWESMKAENGPAARQGDLVQVTKVEIEGDRIKLELNNGWKKGPKWYERIEVGVGGGTRTTPVSRGGMPVAQAGTLLSLEFPGGVPPMDAPEFKKMLAPILDFEQRSATEQYVANLPPEIREAIENKRALEGMDRDQVLLALGRPRNKVRETKEGEDLEDWIYGQAPGRIVFVTFGSNGKVAKVKETYAGLGTQTQVQSPF
jgi:hypothetical protein